MGGHCESSCGVGHRFGFGDFHHNPTEFGDFVEFNGIRVGRNTFDRRSGFMKFLKYYAEVPIHVHLYDITLFFVCASIWRRVSVRSCSTPHFGQRNLLSAGKAECPGSKAWFGSRFACI